VNPQAVTPELGRFGIWSGGLRVADLAEATDSAAELEELGYGTLWLPGRGTDVFERVAALLDATQRIVVATGIISIWQHDPAEVADAHARLRDRYPGRFLLGVGVSHARSVDREEPGRYRRPLERLSAFLDGLDAASRPVAKEERILASLGPKSLALARDRAAGSHTYLVTQEHTRFARSVLGPGPLLAPEQGIVLEEDPVVRRRVARERHLERYLGLANYTRNWLRTGFEPADLEAGGSDRLVDAMIAGGTPRAAVERAELHLAAGADHVSFQVITARDELLPRPEWRALAAVLDPSAR
jgi:probable F420-dependent oxidoreductase